jgi:hypothetical protein
VANDERDKYFEERAGTKEARFHVVPHEEEGWAVKTEGIDEPNYLTDSRTEAINEAKRLAEEKGTMAIIHDQDGKIEEQHEYK